MCSCQIDSLQILGSTYRVSLSWKHFHNERAAARQQLDGQMPLPHSSHDAIDRLLPSDDLPHDDTWQLPSQRVSVTKHPPHPLLRDGHRLTAAAPCATL